MAHGLKESLNQILKADHIRAHLNNLIAHFKAQVKLQKMNLGDSLTPIQPLIVGSEINALRLNQCLMEKGIYVPAIRPPTVPHGTSRLRISFSALHQDKDVMTLIENILDFESQSDAH
jgi:8-amino-7-oxononanoate synthase